MERKRTVSKKPQRFVHPYDAKKFIDTIPAFANVMAEEMKSWRDDR